LGRRGQPAKHLQGLRHPDILLPTLPRLTSRNSHFSLLSMLCKKEAESTLLQFRRLVEHLYVIYYGHCHIWLYLIAKMLEYV